MLAVCSPQGRCLLGVARAEITPPAGIYHRMWGAATHTRATGVHRPLTATAAVFRPAPVAGGASGTGHSANEQVLVAVDHCLLWGQEMQKLLARLERATGAVREDLLVAFSHTHASGLLDSSRASLPGGELIAPYLEFMAEQLAHIVRQARETALPATIVAGQGTCDLAAHRDLPDPSTGQPVCGFNPNGPADTTLMVARATDDQGATLATFVNYACHPTTLGWQNTLISPDFPGAMREIVEAQTGAPCLFLQGASGDLGPREGFAQEAALADRNGRQLGHAALAVLHALPPPGTRFEYTGPVVSGATLGVWRHVAQSEEALAQMQAWRTRRFTVELPYRDDLRPAAQVMRERGEWLSRRKAAESCRDAASARDCHAMIERMDRQLTRLAALPEGSVFPFPVVTWQTGGLLWVGVEGEPYQILQQRLRANLPDQALFVMGLANGSRCSYLPTRETYGTGIYQETIALLAPGSLETLIEEISRRLSTKTV
jgi:hypothetical protein